MRDLRLYEPLKLVKSEFETFEESFLAKFVKLDRRSFDGFCYRKVHGTSFGYPLEIDKGACSCSDGFSFTSTASRGRPALL